MNKDVAEMIRAYAAASDFLEAERMARLAKMTPEESREIFEALYALWSQTGRGSGGDREALDRLKIDHLIEQRRAFERLARRKGLL